MKTTEIRLNSVTDLKNFVNIVNKYDYEVDLTSGRYVVDAKSLMGIFSLDLEKPIRVEAQTEDAGALFEELKAFQD